MRSWLGGWIAVMGLMATPAHADKRCTVGATKSVPFFVDVTPKGAARIALYVRDQRVTLTPAVEAPARVHLTGALELDAVAAPDRLPLRIATDTDAYNAMVHLARDTGGVPGGIVLHKVVRGSYAEVDVRVGDVKIAGLLLPCSALTLDAVAPPEMSGGETGDEDRFVAKTNVLHLRAFPNRGSQIDLELGQPDAIEFRRVEAQGRWWRISHVWLDGTSLDGWVQADALAPAKHGALHDSPGYEPPTSTPCTRAPKARDNERLARATIAAGTKVFAGRDVGEWATVRTTEPVTVRYLARDEWMELVTVPGLASASECPEGSTVLEDAWVPRAAVHLLDATEGVKTP
jgi:hypothetical protein